MTIPSRLPSISGIWRTTSKSSADIDLEAQTITGMHAPFTVPPVSEPVYFVAASARTPEHDATSTDPVDDFFGATRPRATRESRHDSYVAPARVMDGDAPPPYAETADPPTYNSTSTEPETLAMYFFKFGFLFPLFWVFGIAILFSPLTAPVDFEPTKSEAERQELVRIMRETEMKWAKRCGWALLVLLVAGGIFAALIITIANIQPS